MKSIRNNKNYYFIPQSSFGLLTQPKWCLPTVIEDSWYSCVAELLENMSFKAHHLSLCYANHNNENPLSLAMKFKHQQIIELLIKNIVDVLYDHIEQDGTLFDMLKKHKCEHSIGSWTYAQIVDLTQEIYNEREIFFAILEKLKNNDENNENSNKNFAYGDTAKLILQKIHDERMSNMFIGGIISVTCGCLAGITIITTKMIMTATVFSFNAVLGTAISIFASLSFPVTALIVGIVALALIGGALLGYKKEIHSENIIKSINEFNHNVNSQLSQNNATDQEPLLGNQM